MLRVNQVNIKTDHTKQQLKNKAASILKVSPGEIKGIEIVRQSIDARKKPNILYSYSLNVVVPDEERVLKRLKGKENRVTPATEKEYVFPSPSKLPKERPVIVGMGPAGLFCGYYLALRGLKPILLERGKAVEDRIKDVEEFWNTGVLNVASNVQFGEGGAGTFSDGKLNTLVKDKDGRNMAVLRTLIRFGADESIAYSQKPHIGTDKLISIVRNMRNEIIRLGGEVQFQSCVTQIEMNGGAVEAVIVNHSDRISCKHLVLAIGHSARDTFEMLYKQGIPMETKAFAVGLRVEHPQKMINESQYGVAEPGSLGAAPYKVVAKAKNGRGVYSFCMCPGGYVVNASSEEGHLAVNGMSYSKRDGENANSAIVVTVTPEDFGDDHPLAGVKFQRMIEKNAYNLAKGKIPVQRYFDFKKSVRGVEEETKITQNPSTVPMMKGEYEWADVSRILTGEINEAIIDGMESFGRQIKGFDSPDAILSGVESRTSSPVRIVRNEVCQSEVKGLYPCGEGAGYAGGITSAAMDGMRIAEAIVKSCE